MTSPVKNQVYTAEILGYSSEGLGIARIGGQVVFVHDAIAGEVCDILVMKVLKKTAFGKVVAWKAVSPHRREPDCPYYRRCGGCAYRHMDYAEELWAKEHRVQDALTRLGGSSVAVEEVLGAAEPLHYRNKSQYSVSADGRVGFYRARTHQVTNLDACLIQMPQADAAAGALRTYLAEYRVPGYDEKTGTGLVRHLYVRTNAKGQSLICVVVNGEKLPREDALVEAMRQAVPEAVGVVLNSNTRRSNVILGDQYRTLWGEDTLTDTLCGHSFRLSIPSFYQVNRDQAEVLYRKAVEYAGLTGTELVLDLYCGAGTITLTMADKAKKVIGAEIISAAVENARENAADNGVEKCGVFLRRRRGHCIKAGRGGSASGCDLRGPAPEGPSPGGYRCHGADGAAAYRLCLLRPGHPGPGCEAAGPARIPGRPGRSGGSVPWHGTCGDGGSLVAEGKSTDG